MRILWRKMDRMIRSVCVLGTDLRGVEVKVVQPRQGIMQEIWYEGGNYLTGCWAALVKARRDEKMRRDFLRVGKFVGVSWCEFDEACSRF